MKSVMGIPQIGFGTSRLGEATYASILAALELGYHHLDTAQSYGSEEAIGRALKTSGKRRDEIFITTKVADTNLTKDRFMQSLRASLDRLGVGEVDLALIHWPSHRDAVPLAEYMHALVEAKALGLTRLIGVSNFPIAVLEKSIAIIGPGQIVNNQFELHPYLQNRKLREYCQRNGISVTAYMPLAKGTVLGEPAVRAIAEKRGTTPAAVVLAFLIQQGIIVIPASTRRENIASNLKALSLTLADDEMAAMAALERGGRMIKPAKSPVWD